MTLPAPLVSADGVEGTAEVVGTKVTMDVIAPVQVLLTITGIATAAPRAAPTGLEPIVIAVGTIRLKLGKVDEINGPLPG